MANLLRFVNKTSKDYIESLLTFESLIDTDTGARSNEISRKSKV
jgi:hypothetical protein